MAGELESYSDDSAADSFDDLSDEDVEAFKKYLPSNKKFEKDAESNSEDDGMESIDDDDENDKDEDEMESGEDESDDEDESDVESDENESNASITQQFSNIDMASEIEKGEAVKNQKAIWNKLLEARIKFQKLLILTNKLPQESLSSKEVDDNFKKSLSCVKRLMKSFLDLNDELLDRTPELGNPSSAALQKEIDDDEILSDTDEENARHEVNEESKTDNSAEKGVKRKHFKDHNKELAKRFKSLEPYRNNVIQKFDEKTRLTTGKVTPKSFAAFDNSALKQIEQILRDKSRLVQRTQLKRSLYRVLGKPEVKEDIEAPKQDMLLKDYDPEIFDDDDFYRQILKDVIESKSFGLDPSIIRKQMEIQKVRSKMKRKIDTRASKGRKLRFDVHPKMVNFMAPYKTCHITDEERQSFLKCLFGGK